MGENRGQTIFLSVIGIATLLVAIVGATFAYFTTKVSSEGTGGSVEGTTATIGNTTVKFEDEADSHYDKLDYPGGLALVGAKATIEKASLDAGTDSNDYQATFGLTITYQNPTATDMNWELYKIAGSSPLGTGDFSGMTCGLRTKDSGSSTFLWYADESSTTETDVCKLDETLTGKLSTQIASGTLAKNTESDTTIKGESGMTGLTLNSKDNTDDYYYLVVEYPNSEANSADDQGKTVKFTLGIDSTTIQVDVAPSV